MLRNGRREVFKSRYGPDVFQEFALDFIRRHRARPFFFYHAIVLAHGTNSSEAAETTPENRGRPPKSAHEAYAALIRYADRQVGEFVAELDRLGLRDNTIVIVASDNGSDGTLAGRRDGRTVKGGLYRTHESGNVALLINSPKLVRAGRVTPLADFTDLYPTICDLAGVTIPGSLRIDGRSFARYLRGEGESPRAWIFNQYRPDRVVRNVRFKLYHDGRLFDVERDPDETRPLAKGASASADAARRELQAVLDAMPEDTPLPFPHRSLSAFRQRSAAKASGPP